jgi:hypothetical protein
MTKKETALLTAAHDHILYVKKRLDHITDTMAVNGETGLENILSSQYRKVGELMDATERLRTRWHLRKAIQRTVSGSPLLSFIAGLLADKKVVWFIIMLLAALFGVSEWARTFIGKG